MIAGSRAKQVTNTNVRVRTCVGLGVVVPTSATDPHGQKLKVGKRTGVAGNGKDGSETFFFSFSIARDVSEAERPRIQNLHNWNLQ